MGKVRLSKSEIKEIKKYFDFLHSSDSEIVSLGIAYITKTSGYKKGLNCRGKLMMYSSWDECPQRESDEIVKSKYTKVGLVGELLNIKYDAAKAFTPISYYSTMSKFEAALRVLMDDFYIVRSKNRFFPEVITILYN